MYNGVLLSEEACTKMNWEIVPLQPGDTVVYSAPTRHIDHMLTKSPTHRAKSHSRDIWVESGREAQ